MLEVGKTYANGKRTREIIKIEDNYITYKTQAGEVKFCFIATFEDWVKNGQRTPTRYSYEILYTKDGNDYITTDSIKDIVEASGKAVTLAAKPGISNVKIVEYKTTEKIVMYFSK